MKSGEKIFRQMKQNSARVVESTRRDFVKYHGKDSADFSCDEFLEIPLIRFYRQAGGPLLERTAGFDFPLAFYSFGWVHIDPDLSSKDRIGKSDHESRGGNDTRD